MKVAADLVSAVRDLLMRLLAIVLDEVTTLLVIVTLLVPVAGRLNIDVVHFGILVVVDNRIF